MNDYTLTFVKAAFQKLKPKDRTPEKLARLLEHTWHHKRDGQLLADGAALSQYLAENVPLDRLFADDCKIMGQLWRLALSTELADWETPDDYTPPDEWYDWLGHAMTALLYLCWDNEGLLPHLSYTPLQLEQFLQESTPDQLKLF